MTNVTFVKGVGPGFAKILERIHIKTIWDLLCHLPVGTENYKSLSECKTPPKKNDKICVDTKILSYTQKGSRHVYQTRILQQNGMFFSRELDLVFFKPQAFLVPGSSWTVWGTLDTFPHYTFVHPDKITPKTSKPTLSFHKYPLTKGLSNTKIRHLIQQCLENLTEIPEWIPQETLRKHSWLSFLESLRCLHQPFQKESVKETARQRLAFEELVAHQLFFLQEDQEQKKQKAFACCPNSDDLSQFLSQLPFALTSDQERVWHEIQHDLNQPIPMHRLIHADVGSGKTVLGFLALLYMAFSGHQGCFLVPTEVLALQHYHQLKQFLHSIPLRVALLTGSHKKHVAQIAEGYFHIIIGTHALFQEKVTFKSLGLVIMDEQHRFGVMQRLRLIEKGQTPCASLTPHTLFMSATPIPRTFEKAFLGHVTVSRMSEKPFVTSTTTYIVSSGQWEALEKYLEKTIAQGQLIYWVCPLIREENVQEGSLYHREKILEQWFPGKILVLHGKMSEAEKTTIIQTFKEGKKPILLATTVIEVGVHVDHATVMVVEESQRFGLSQLHQLRGRVGRSRPGTCFFVYGNSISATARRRLQILKNTMDGFQIAEMDWKLRGGGELMGTLQSGLPRYRFVNLETDVPFLDSACTLAKSLWQQSESISKNLLLQLFSYQKGSFHSG